MIVSAYLIVVAVVIVAAADAYGRRRYTAI